ncbi:MAG: hypothetical protein MZV70_00440 [Desulfobacterales bacterium]|nr:hypothetical protein [Desulfobacterales bacterium]
MNKDFISGIAVQVVDEQSILAAKRAIEDILRKRHKIRSDQKDDFTVIDLKDVMVLKTQATETITVLGKIAAAVSFLIGGLGILSIMILIVNERRVEIGIRRAVGSRKGTSSPSSSSNHPSSLSAAASSASSSALLRPSSSLSFPTCP